MIELSIDANVPEIALALDDFRARQVPFATALALTRTAQDSQERLRDALPKRFTIRNNYLEKGIRIQAANKRTQEAKVSTIDDELAIHIEGGQKRAKGRSIAIPRAILKGVSSPVPGSIKQGKTDRLRKRRRPPAVVHLPRAFEAPIRGGHSGIFRRVGKARYPIEFLYRLHQGSVKIDSSFDFERIVGETVSERWESNWGAAFGKALATSR